MGFCIPRGAGDRCCLGHLLPRFHEIHKSRCRMCRTNKKRGLQRPNNAKNAEIIGTHWELPQTLVRRKMPFSLRYPVWLWEAVDPPIMEM